MCGIAGIATKNDARRYEKRELAAMTACLAHRGPDGQGIATFEHCGLGHRRLSIVDLKTGDQPMFSRDRQKALIFNGEIFGYKDIRATLGAYPFATTSDTEVILALYEKYTDDTKEFVSHLPGQFAFALWDEQRQSLTCARDRFGEKPFYYAFGEHGEFLFASEIKSLLASDLIKPQLDRSAVTHYLKNLYVHPATTIYKNIFTLPPAHLLTWRDGKIKVERYWQMPALNESIPLDDAVPVFKKLLDEAVQKQLIADVPVGAFLSGGLDSSTIVALASKYTPHLQTFSFGFKGARGLEDETHFAREIATKYKTNHTELSAEAENIAELLLKMQDIYDEPFADSSNIPTYLISKLCRQYAKVVVTGDGGDELLAGYGWYKPFLHFADPSTAARHALIGMTAKAMRRSAAVLGVGVAQAGDNLYHRHQGAALKQNYASVFEAHLAQLVLFSDDELATMSIGGVDEKEFHHMPSWPLTNTLDDAMRLDVEDYMPGDILVKVDRASMANGLELRAPFLDVDFASFCLTLPYQLKINRDSDKIILRRAFENSWTDSIRHRRKQGFGAPVHEWLKQPSLQKLRAEYLDDPRKKIFEILSFKGTRPFVNKLHYKTWTLLVLALWLEKHSYS